MGLCDRREGGQHGAASPRRGHWFPSAVPPALLGMALPGHSWLPSPGLALTLCRVLALAERVSLQHVLAAGTPVGEQRELWLSHRRLWDFSVAMQPGRETRKGWGTGRQSGSRGLADG